MPINYKQCPNCGSKNAMTILYGKPISEAFEMAEAGKIKLGGCSISMENPEYCCKDCGHEWNKGEAIDAAYRRIKGLKASVGGFFGGYYKVEIDLAALQVRWSSEGGLESDKAEKSIRRATTDTIIEEMKMVNLLDWKRKYIEPGVMDGTSWSVEIIRDGRNIHKSGSNKFPEEWELFCSSIRKITERDFS